MDDDTNTFISCGLSNGTVSLSSRLGGKRVESKRGRRRIDDNLPHLVVIQRHENNFTVLVDGVKEQEMVMKRPFAHPLLVDTIVLGDGGSQNSSHADLFKGTLQDVRVNDVNVLLSESAPDFLKEYKPVGNRVMRNNLLMGTISDELCEDLKPCLNEGKCSNTFNDFECSCIKGFFGKDCGLIDFCSSSPCPESSSCQNTHGGYICKDILISKRS
jgi:protein crumbs